MSTIVDGRVSADRDDLEQVEVARRIEEVRAQPALPEPLGASLGDGAQRNAGRVGADDRVARDVRFDAREQRLLDVEPFDDRFDDPVGRRQSPEVLVEAAGETRRCVCAVKNGSGFSAASPARGLRARPSARDVEQQHRERRRWRGVRRSARPSSPAPRTAADRIAFTGPRPAGSVWRAPITA